MCRWMWLAIAVITAGCMAGLADARSQPPDDASVTNESAPQANAILRIRYVPPDRGAPEERISGGTRGRGAGQLQVDVLAPERTGLTLRRNPTLYWFSSRPITARIELTIVDDATNKTVLKAFLPSPVAAGLHEYALAGTPVILNDGSNYQWSVTVVQSPKEPSRNIVASGMIRPVASVPNGLVMPAGATGSSTSYASAGLWYDALDAISQAIRQAPANRQLRLQRAELLDDVGLHEAAAFDRSGMSP
jgi:hypothetical protein